MPIDLDIISNLGLTSAENKAPKKEELGQDQFLQLLTTQLTHQDPTKPSENGDFLTQLAQFGTVEGIGDLKDSFDLFAQSITSSQSLEAASLVGRSVAYPGDSGILAVNEPLSGSVKLESATNQVTINIQNQQGQFVKSINLGVQGEGLAKFEWDGTLDDGSQAPPGVYKITAEAVIDEKNTALQTLMKAKVESVDIGNAQKGIVLNLGELGSIEFSKIKQVS